jgi:FAD/FMN-containing dehydrogenase
MDKILMLDQENGMLVAEAGLSLDDVLRVVIPKGWFVPVVPGTRFVTLGGCVANDIHGKNHHQKGTFGNNVEWLELLRSDGQRLRCSREENSGLFSATIGGLGLTGLVTIVALRLRQIESAWIDMETVKFENLDDFFAINSESESRFEHTVAWIDCTSRGRGHYLRGNPSTRGGLQPHRQGGPTIPFDFPGWGLSRWSVSLFNTAYFHRQVSRESSRHVHYAPFFFPLDSIQSWNRIYGSRGFYQYQSVIPWCGGVEASKEMLRLISESGQGSFLAVLKTFGHVQSPGLLSFPMSGVTLALDFPNQGESTLRLFDKLNRVVKVAGGRLYPAKDACMPPAMFKDGYPRLNEFIEALDPAFSSSFWRRVSI